MPKILFVAMSNSIHTARWINEIIDQGFDIHIFPSTGLSVHPSLKNITVHGFDFTPENVDKSLRFPSAFPCAIPGVSNKFNILIPYFRKFLASHQKNAEDRKTRQLIHVIKKIKPDLVHTLEMQHAGYLALKAKEIMGDEFPTWIYTPWGSDIFLFGRLPDHVDRVKAVLGSCDYFCPKSNRDIRLAKEYGFKGKILDVFPGNGGLDTIKLRTYWGSNKPSKRRIIMLKGYQGWAGRAHVGLRAIELCADELKHYSIMIHSSSTDVNIKAELISHDLDIPIKIIPHISHEDLLRLFGQARISIGLSISDGVPNSLLESMAMGTYPIESNTSCADEWIIDGENGLIVPPEDPEIIAQAIRKALNDDQLIDNAAEQNYQIICNRMDKSVIKPKISTLYTNLFTTEMNGKISKNFEKRKSYEQ